MGLVQFQNRVLLPGRVISVPFGPYKHFGIVGLQELDGTPVTVISNAARHQGVVEETLASFCEGKDYSEESLHGELPWQTVLYRGRAFLFPKYDVLRWNCEHFVRWCHDLKSESPQVAATFAIAVIGLGVAALARAA